MITSLISLVAIGFIDCFPFPNEALKTFGDLISKVAILVLLIGVVLDSLRFFN